MMFEYSLDNLKVSNLIKNSISNVLKNGSRTKDISMSSQYISTSEMGDANNSGNKKMFNKSNII